MINLPAFKNYLESKKYSSATIRNYLSDVHHYSTYETPELYLASIKKDINYPRYISSLNKYFEFAIDQHLVDKNPLQALLKNKPRFDIDVLLDQYKTYLTKKHKMPFTIKNYLNDIKQFINFCES